MLNPYATGGGETSIELGDGSRHPLYTTTAYPEGWMTPGFARYDRTNHRLQMPNGYIYEFGHEADLGDELGVVRYVTKIWDPFDNKIEFSYFSSPGPRDGVSQIRQFLSPTQVRYVNFTYDSALKSLDTMSYDGRTWHYEHTAQGTSGLSLLREVRPPLGPSEEYDYTALPGELTRYETPSGGVTTYTYQDAYRVAGPVTNRTRVVTQRAVSGRLVTPGTWTFARVGVSMPDACASLVRNSWYPSPVSRRTMLRNAAFASSVVASMATLWPWTNPASATRCKTHVKTARCVSRSIKRRVREIVEWSGGASGKVSPRKSRSVNESGRPPGDATLRIQPFEVADQQQPKIDARRQARSAHRLGIERRTRGLGEVVKALFLEQLIQSCIERVARRRWQLRRRHPHARRSIASPFPHRHRRQCSTRDRSCRSLVQSFTTGC